MTTATRTVRAGALVLGALLLAAPLAAQEPEPEQRTHTVQRGNTLWGLAEAYYNNPFLWPVIAEANRDIVADPHWIYPDQRLVIPGLPTARTSPAVDRLRGEPTEPVDVVIEVALEPPARTLFYSEPPPQRDIMILEAEAPTAIQPGEFYAAPWLGELSQLPIVGRMVRVNDPDRATVRDAPSSARPFDEIFVSFARGAQAPRVGDRLMMVREGRRIGGTRVIEPTGMVTVTRVEREVFGARVTDQFTAVQRGDVAIPVEPFPLRPGEMPRPVADGGDGVILGFEKEQALYGTTEHAFISIGRAHGLRVGDQLVAYQPPRRERAHELPPEIVARVQVVRVGDNTATVRITRTRHGVLDDGLPVRVVAEMP